MCRLGAGMKAGRGRGGWRGLVNWPGVEERGRGDVDTNVGTGRCDTISSADWDVEVDTYLEVGADVVCGCQSACSAAMLFWPKAYSFTYLKLISALSASAPLVVTANEGVQLTLLARCFCHFSAT